jgi:hypothetical protein
MLPPMLKSLLNAAFSVDVDVSVVVNEQARTSINTELFPTVATVLVSTEGFMQSTTTVSRAKMKLDHQQLLT